MRLRLIAGEPGSDSFMAGYTAHLSLGGVDISNYVSRVVVECDGDKPINATIECLLTELEIDLPAVVEAIDIMPHGEDAPESVSVSSLGALLRRILPVRTS